MKIKITLIAVIAAALAGCTSGCSTIQSTVTPALVQQGAQAGVAAAVKQWPSAIPGVQAAANVICSDAGQTNLDPNLIIADIGKLDPSINTPLAILIENTALNGYTFIWESYGAGAVTNSPVLQSYLLATCNGMNAGLGTNNVPLFGAARNSWPIIRYHQ